MEVSPTSSSTILCTDADKRPTDLLTDPGFGAYFTGSLLAHLYVYLGALSRLKQSVFAHISSVVQYCFAFSDGTCRIPAPASSASTVTPTTSVCACESYVCASSGTSNWTQSSSAPWLINHSIIGNHPPTTTWERLRAASWVPICFRFSWLSCVAVLTWPIPGP